MMTMRHAVAASALILTIAGSVLAAPSPSFAGEQARSSHFDSVEVNPEFAAKGYGETKPVAENEKNGEDNPEGRAQNRRVKITYN